MSILTSIQFYLPLGLGFFCLVSLFASMFGNSWRTVEYDGKKAKELVERGSVLSMDINNAQGYITMNLTAENNESFIRMSFPMLNYGGLWGSCDTISDSVRSTLSGLKQQTQCLNYMKITKKDTASVDEMDWGLIRSSEVCAIVATISFLTAAALGIFSVVRQQVVSAMITGVCCLAAGLYTMFVVILMHLKIANMIKYDYSGTKFPDQGLMRNVNIGWSMYMGWVSFLLITLDGVFWIFLSRKMSMVMMNYPPKYHQICSAYAT